MRRPAFFDAKTVIRPPFFEIKTEVSVEPQRLAREYEMGIAKPVATSRAKAPEPVPVPVPVPAASPLPAPPAAVERVRASEPIPAVKVSRQTADLLELALRKISR